MLNKPYKNKFTWADAENIQDLKIILLVNRLG